MLSGNNNDVLIDFKLVFIVFTFIACISSPD